MTGLTKEPYDMYNYNTNPEINQQDAETLLLLDSSFKYFNKTPITLFRGETSLAALENRIVDSKVINSQYLSTSLDVVNATSFNNHNFDIVFMVVPGTSFFPIFEISASPYECEILFSRFIDIIMEVKTDICVNDYGEPIYTNCQNENKIQYIFKIIPENEVQIQRAGGKYRSPYKKIYDLIVNYEYKKSSKSKKQFWKNKMKKTNKKRKNRKNCKSKNRK